jgi:hypothetical protein
VAIVLFLGGVQLLSTGVLDEYIGSIFDESKHRPEYVVKALVNMDPGEHGNCGFNPREDKAAFSSYL